MGGQGRLLVKMGLTNWETFGLTRIILCELFISSVTNLC